MKKHFWQRSSKHTENIVRSSSATIPAMHRQLATDIIEWRTLGVICFTLLIQLIAYAELFLR